MILLKHIKDLLAHLGRLKNENAVVGFVPTMGALHAGHLSLIAESRKAADVTVCSIFVNPVQFNNKEDFQKYPVTIEQDILLLEESGCDVLFMPGENEIYPDATSKNKQYDIGYLENILEGKYRPGHFQGVCLVMDKLLHIVKPDYLFLGQKDYQQCLIIKRLIEILGMDIKMIMCPVMREDNGLAMSSRNKRLNETDRQTASLLYKIVSSMKENIITKNFLLLKQQALASLENAGIKTDYLALAKRSDLTIIDDKNSKQELIILIAAYINNVRLIDNVMI